MPRKKKIDDDVDPLEKGICPNCLHKMDYLIEKWRCFKCGVVVEYGDEK